MTDLEKVSDVSGHPHILVVDDDDRIRALVSRYLNENGFVSFTASDASAAKEIMTLSEFDAIVLDVMMPGQDGRSLTVDIRKQRDVPILLLTAMGEAEDRVEGFRSGADDYLTKPFDPRELVLRLQSILRRRLQRGRTSSKSYRIGEWMYDPRVPELSGAENSIRLTDVEVNLLQALLKNPGVVSSREDLADICGIDAGERTIDVQVTRLRRKLEKDSKVPRYLLTLRGKGYLLRADEMEL